MNNSQLAHIWANRLKDSGKGSSMFFEGPKIFSYGHHFEIARLLPGNVILYNSASYSNSTAKHQIHVRRAIDYDNNKVFTVPHFEPSQYMDNVKWFKTNINELTKDAARARKNREWILGRIVATIGEMLSFIAVFNLEKDDEVLEMERRFKNSEILTDTEIDNIKAEDKAIKSAAIAKRKEDIEDWMNGETRYLNSLDEIYLRVKDETVETSHGATVPLKEAKILFRALKTGKPPVHGFLIGSYTVHSYINGILKIGCHKLNDKEINRFAASQGWIKSIITA